MVNVSGISRAGLIGKVLRLPLQLVPQNAVVPILQGPLKGMKWIAGASTHGCWLGSYEADKQLVFAQTIQPGMTVFDIGANVGFYSLLASRLVGVGGHVDAFEPLPRNIDLLKRHLSINRVENATVWPNAVADTHGCSDFVVAQSPSMGHIGGDGDQVISVEMISLDEVADEGRLRSPDVIKCDIEGAEVEFLTGAKELLKRAMPIIFLATHGPDMHSKSCELLWSFGYELEPLDADTIRDASELLAKPATR